MSKEPVRESGSTESQLEFLLAEQVEELRALELLLSQKVHWNTLAKLPPDDIRRTTFSEMALVAEVLPEVYQPSVSDYLASALDFEIKATTEDFTQTEILFSTGGPGVWLEVDAPRQLTLHGAWWGEAATVELDLPALARVLSDLASAS